MAGELTSKLDTRAFQRQILLGSLNGPIARTVFNKAIIQERQIEYFSTSVAGSQTAKDVIQAVVQEGSSFFNSLFTLALIADSPIRMQNALGMLYGIDRGYQYHEQFLGADQAILDVVNHARLDFVESLDGKQLPFLISNQAGIIKDRVLSHWTQTQLPSELLKRENMTQQALRSYNYFTYDYITKVLDRTQSNVREEITQPDNYWTETYFSLLLDPQVPPRLKYGLLLSTHSMNCVIPWSNCVSKEASIWRIADPSWFMPDLFGAPPDASDKDYQIAQLRAERDNALIGQRDAKAESARLIGQNIAQGKVIAASELQLTGLQSRILSLSSQLQESQQTEASFSQRIDELTRLMEQQQQSGAGSEELKKSYETQLQTLREKVQAAETRTRQAELSMEPLRKQFAAAMAKIEALQATISAYEESIREAETIRRLGWAPMKLLGISSREWNYPTDESYKPIEDIQGIVDARKKILRRAYNAKMRGLHSDTAVLPEGTPESIRILVADTITSLTDAKDYLSTQLQGQNNS